MDDPRAHRTLVKSPPELWAEVSDVEALAGHLDAFGEIRITRLEPETTVAWEGDRARGTVELEPAGWGTRVTLTARIAAAPAAAEPEPEVEPEAEQREAAAEPAAGEPEAPAATEAHAPAPAERRRWRWWPFGRQRVEAAAPAPAPSPAAQPEPEPEREPEPAPAPEDPRGGPIDAGRAEAILAGVLDDLGAAHHRPFSRG